MCVCKDPEERIIPVLSPNVFKIQTNTRIIVNPLTSALSFPLALNPSVKTCDFV
jgi:hypothetical protein